MNEIELTELFVAYRRAQEEVARLELAIKDQVLSLHESQRIAGVKATYYQETIECDYEAAAKAAKASDEIIASFTTQKSSTSWKDVAKAVGANLEPFKAIKPPRVVVDLK